MSKSSGFSTMTKIIIIGIAAVIYTWSFLTDRKVFYGVVGLAAVLFGIRWLIEVLRGIDNITRELREIKALLSKQS